MNHTVRYTNASLSSYVKNKKMPKRKLESNTNFISFHFFLFYSLTLNALVTLDTSLVQHQCLPTSLASPGRWVYTSTLCAASNDVYFISFPQQKQQKFHNRRRWQHKDSLAVSISNHNRQPPVSGWSRAAANGAALLNQFWIKDWHGNHGKYLW